jgi:hypothetical protein
VTEPRLRPYAPGDEAHILTLHRRVFTHTPTEANWRRKFLNNPAGPAIILVLEQAGRVVGHYAFVPARMSYGGQVCAAVRGVDLMLAPEVRRGLGGPRLALRLNDEGYARTSARADFLYSLPRLAPRRLFLKHGGRTRVGPVTPVHKRLNPAHWLRGRAGWAALAPAARWLGRAWLRAAAPALTERADADARPLVKLAVFDERFDQLWDEIAPRYPLTLLRDARYLNWRFAGPDVTRLAVVDADGADGWVVLGYWLQAGWRGARLLDLAARDEATAGRLLRAALAELRRRGVDVVHGWMMPHTPDWPAAQRAGFKPRPSGMDLLVRPYAGGRLPLETLTRLQSWHVTLADADAD